MNSSKAAAAEGARYLAIGTAALAVGTPATWLATAWALSQAAAAASAGQAAEGWILAMRPVLIPASMVIAWFAARGSSSKGWARAVRILGIGAAVSVIVLFIDGVMSGGLQRARRVPDTTDADTVQFKPDSARGMASRRRLGGWLDLGGAEALRGLLPDPPVR